MKSIVILISGRGSNMEALVRAAADGVVPARVAAVIANRPDAIGLQIAEGLGVETRVVDHTQYGDRSAFDAALALAIDSYAPDLVVLAGFMRILTDGFVERYAGRMFNIHPSLLPAFKGLHTHRRVLEEGVRVHGCTVHFVTPELDHGPVIIQAVVPVLDGDDEQMLAARVLEQEHQIYPMAVRWFAEERLRLVDGHVVFEAEQAAEGALISPQVRVSH